MGVLGLLPGCQLPEDLFLDDAGVDSLGIMVDDGGEENDAALADATPDTADDDAADAGAAVADAADDLAAEDSSPVDMGAEMPGAVVPSDADAPDAIVISPCNPGSQPLPPTGWTGTASAQSTKETPAKTFDGMLTTRWSTGKDAAIGDWFRLDLQAAHTINRLLLDSGPFSGDYPRGYTLSLSIDDVTYHPVSSGAGTDQQTIISFPAESARYMKVTITAPSTGKWWSIAELIVCGN